MVRSKLIGIAIWLMIAGVLGAIGQVVFRADFWTVAAFTLVGLLANALIIEWEDNQPGGWEK